MFIILPLIAVLFQTCQGSGFLTDLWCHSACLTAVTPEVNLALQLFGVADHSGRAACSADFSGGPEFLVEFFSVRQ